MRWSVGREKIQGRHTSPFETDCPWVSGDGLGLTLRKNEKSSRKNQMSGHLSYVFKIREDNPIYI